MGARFAVIVRPADRALDTSRRDRWQTLADQREQAAELMTRWVPETMPEKVAGLADDPGWAIAAVTCPEMNHTPRAIEPLLDLGASAALWLLGDHEQEECNRTLTDTIASWEVMQLPERVRGVRQVAWEDNGATAAHPLVLLWDDPTRPPPTKPIWVAPAAREAK
jgi:hypothetical protein